MTTHLGSDHNPASLLAIARRVRSCSLQLICTQVATNCTALAVIQLPRNIRLETTGGSAGEFFN